MVVHRIVSSPLDYDRGGGQPSATPCAAAAAVLRRPPRARRGSGRGGRAAADRSRPRQPRHRAAAARRRGARARPRRTRRCTAIRRSAASPARRRRSPAATATSTASSSTRSARSRSSRARRPRSSSWRWRSPTTATRSCCPTRTTPTIPRGSRSPAPGCRPSRSIPEAGWAPDLDAAPAAAALFLNYPSNPCAVCAPAGTFEAAVRWAGRTGGYVVHDAAYTDLVFDGRSPESFLATPGAKEVGVEMWTMSKTYGMAGWRIGFVLGNAEVVERINLFNDHSRVGIFAPLQAAAVAALEGPQDLGRRARRHLPGAPRPARRGAARADRLRGHVLRLAAAARRA